jgi:hypothetical protein
MRYTLVGLTATALITLGSGAQAGPLSAVGGLGAASKAVSLREDAQFVWGGHRYCWYDDGWRGPGWYRCGFSLRHGYGWGGPMGWQGWHHGERRGGGPGPGGGGGPPAAKGGGPGPGSGGGGGPPTAKGGGPGPGPGGGGGPAGGPGGGGPAPGGGAGSDVRSR